MFTDAGVAIEVGVVLAGIIAAAIWLKSSLVKQRSQELESLVETRGQRIEDLETHLEELGVRIHQLEGQIELLSGRLGESIAAQVTERVEITLLKALEA